MRLLAVLFILATLPLGSVRADGLGKQEVRDRWLSRLDGRHFVSKVTLHYHYGAKRETRVLTVWRDDREAGERVMIRFQTPTFLRGLGLLYLERPDGPNDYFIYQPATRRVRRIPESAASQDIYGVDLEFIGFGVAQSQPTEVESVTRVDLDGRSVYRLVERAARTDGRFDRRIAYLDQKSFLPVRVEHERNGAVVLVATTEEEALVQGVLTPVRSRFVRPREDLEVVMVVDEVDYERAIPGAFFSTLALIK